MSVYRCYSQKRPGFDVEAQGLCAALSGLNLSAGKFPCAGAVLSLRALTDQKAFPLTDHCRYDLQHGKTSQFNLHPL